MIQVTLVAPKLELPSFDRRDMIRIGAKALESINKRLDNAVGVNDHAMVKLSKSYAKKKSEMGAQAKRNLMLSGAMRGAMVITYADDKSCEIGFTRSSEKIKAAANQMRAPWYGLSKNDEGVVGQFADRILLNKLNG